MGLSQCCDSSESAARLGYFGLFFKVSEDT